MGNKKTFNVLVRFETNDDRIRVRAAAKTLGLSMQQFAQVAIMRWVEVVEADNPLSDDARASYRTR